MAHKVAPKHDVDLIERARGFWVNYNKPVIYIGSAVVILLLGWVVYKFMFQKPKIEKSNDIVFVTQKYFSEFAATEDTTKALLAAKVLNGDGVNPGALKIINKYSGTPAANLCQYYAGACYLSLGQFDKAISHLKKFDGNGATQIQSRAYGMLGDANAELNKNSDALDYYKKAAKVNTKDDFTTSEYLFRAAAYAQSIGKTKDAIDLFKQLKDDYPLTEKGADAARHLAQLGEFAD